MKGLVGLCLLLVLPMATIAVEDGQVMYAAGTIASLKEGALGRLVTTSPNALTFELAGSQLVIPFAKIDSYEYSQRVARHLGVLPGIAAGLVRHRQRKHFLRIVYKEEDNTEQVAIFEIPKEMPRTLLAILQARAPWGCQASTAAKCTQPR